jgi:DNA-damage-inducible protein D
MNNDKEATTNFDSIRKINSYDVEYWSARELMPLLGYQNWRDFHNTIQKAKTACEQSKNVIADHFGDARKPITGGKGAVQRVKDYNLSRFACYLTAQNGDSRKPEIAMAQTYFAIATHENELRQLAEKHKRRIELRERVAEGNKSLNDAAAAVGVQSKSFGTFHNAGYEGLYGGLNVEQVKARKKIGPKEDLLDRAGLMELGANALRIGMTDEKLRSGAVVGEEAAIEAHREAGKTIRQSIAAYGSRMPEDLPTEPSIKPVIDQRQKTRKKVVAQKAQPQLTMFDEAEQESQTEGLKNTKEGEE